MLAAFFALNPASAQVVESGTDNPGHPNESFSLTLTIGGALGACPSGGSLGGSNTIEMDFGSTAVGDRLTGTTSSCLNINVRTNDPWGYSLSVMTASTSGLVGVNNPANIVPIASGTVAVPGEIPTTGGWGFAVPGANRGGATTGFANSYTVDSNNSGAQQTYAGFPVAFTEVARTTTQNNVAGVDTPIFVAVRMSATQAPDVYTGSMSFGISANANPIPAPTITSVVSAPTGTSTQNTFVPANLPSAPTAVAYSGDVITVTGTNFMHNGNPTIVAGNTVDGIAGTQGVTVGTHTCASINVVSATQLTCVLAPGTYNSGAAGGVTVTLISSGGTATLANGINFVTAPRPTGVIIDMAGTTPVMTATVQGGNFTGLTVASAVQIGGRPQSGANSVLALTCNQLSAITASSFNCRIAPDGVLSPTPSISVTHPTNGTGVLPGTAAVATTTQNAGATAGQVAGRADFGTQIASVSNMQTFNVYRCVTMPIGRVPGTTNAPVAGSTAATTSLVTTRDVSTTDARNAQAITVRRMMDGKCWMMTNLRYGGGGTATYNDAIPGRNSTNNAANQAPTGQLNQLMSGAGASTTVDNAPCPDIWDQGRCARWFVENSNPNITLFSGTRCSTTESTGTPPMDSVCGGVYLYNWCAAMGLDSNTTPTCAAVSDTTTGTGMTQAGIVGIASTHGGVGGESLGTYRLPSGERVGPGQPNTSTAGAIRGSSLCPAGWRIPVGRVGASNNTANEWAILNGSMARNAFYATPDVGTGQDYFPNWQPNALACAAGDSNCIVGANTRARLLNSDGTPTVTANTFWRSSFATVTTGHLDPRSPGLTGQSTGHANWWATSLLSGEGGISVYLTSTDIGPGTAPVWVKFRGHSLRCVYP
ncbi:IPT/TIG domain-containing protein [Candidatus Saccharibacteria bacterium]|nr:IPT/TIG domain-containing protein [Candidatus Saccharibacteria bacterium]